MLKRLEYSTRTGRGRLDGSRALLQGTRAERAWESIQAVAASLCDLPRRESEAYRLVDGLAGQALFFAELALVTGADESTEQAFRLIERSIDRVYDSQGGLGLMTSVTGVAWLVAHLEGRICDPDDEDPNADIDDVILKLLDANSDDQWWSAKHDVMTGLAGIGVYALERLPRPSGRKMLVRIVDKLQATRRVFPQGAAWPSETDSIPAEFRDDYADGIFSLGAAHGTPGVIGFLARVHATGIERERVERLLTAAVDWLLANRRRENSGSSFGSWSGDPLPTRNSWCYGNLGIAPCLLTAAKTTGKTAWERVALELALEAADRPVEDAGVIDPGFCHGAAGVGHLFHRLYQATGHPRLREAAYFWFDRTLGFRRPDEGLGGFKSFRKDEGDEQAVWKDDPGLLNGASGIGLTLLSAVSTRASPWDRIFLADTSPAMDRE